MIEAWKRRVAECLARAQELRAKAETLSDAKERETTLRDVATWERMAEWAEKNHPAN